VAEKDEAESEPGPPGEPEPDDNSLGRLLALSDGVFAIAMTLLALDLTATVPSLTGDVSSQQLMHALAQHLSSYWTFVLSFYVIATYWGAHRTLLRSVVVIRQGLVVYTTFLLLVVAAMPFPTNVLGRYGSTPFAVALYGAVNALATLALIGLTYEVRRCGPGERPVTTPSNHMSLLTGWLNLAVFLVCIPAAYLLGHNGPYILLLLVVTNQLPRLQRLARRSWTARRGWLPYRSELSAAGTGPGAAVGGRRSAVRWASQTAARPTRTPITVSASRRMGCCQAACRTFSASRRRSRRRPTGRRARRRRPRASTRGTRRSRPASS
jgi:uncharacterized membrane protein